MSSASIRRKSIGDGLDDVADGVLANDAPWKLIQKNCFTRWTNEHLKTVNKHIADLETDFSDGLRLIALVEILSGKEITQKYTRRPTIRAQKLENITLALTFLESNEGIRIVNIDSTDIVDHKLKLILGLIWTLILHYSISMPVWEDEETATVASTVRQELTPKQRLLAWIQNKVPDRPITNFTSDWNDGRAIGALIDGIAPGLCPDWEDWNAANGIANATEAMDAAEQWLDVPQLIRPDEMCNQMVDELSMMTYLSQFPNAKLKLGAPLRPRTNRSKVRVYGPGIEPTGNKVGVLASFTVETFSAGRGDLEVYFTNPVESVEPCKVVFNNDQHLTYTCCYVPTMEGRHSIHVKFAGRDIPKSPLNVNVEKSLGDASKVTVSGPGVSSSSFIMAKCSTNFKVHTAEAGFGDVNVTVVTPSGTPQIEPRVVQDSSELWTVEYVPSVGGNHLVNVYFASGHIPGSPFAVNANPWVDISKCYASGRGIQPTGLRVNDHASFCVSSSGAGPGDLQVIVTKPNGDDDYVDISKVDETLYKCRYIPTKPGTHTVNVSYGGLKIPRSPFVVNVLPVSTCRVECFGPGLRGGVAGYPACFTVDTNGDKGTLAFSIKGPSQARIDCTDNEDGSADVTYFPLMEGEYAVHVLFDGEDVNGSPFMAEIQPSNDTFNPSKVVATGTGLEAQAALDQPVSFTVNTQSAGDAKLEIDIKDAEFEPVKFGLKKVEHGLYECVYVPRKAVRHCVMITYGSVLIPHAPFRVSVQEIPDPSKVAVHGKALSGRCVTFQPTQFTIDCANAGPGDISVSLNDADGKDIAVETKENSDNTFEVEFVPRVAGHFIARVYFADVEIPGSPFDIKILPHANIDAVLVKGLQTNAFAYAKQAFTVDARAVRESRDGQVQVLITSPSGNKVDANVETLPNKLFKVVYVLAEEGDHQIEVFYDKLALTSNPFHVSVCGGCDVSKVLVSGSGLSDCLTNQEQSFDVDLSLAGHGRLSIYADGPVDTDVDISEKTDSSCKAKYVPTVKGSYNVNITVDNKHVTGSPFSINVKDEVNADKVKVTVTDKTRVGQKCKIDMDVTEAGEADLHVQVTDPNGAVTNADVESMGNEMFKCSFCPQVEGVWLVDVRYGNKKKSGSPILVAVRPVYEPDKVKVYGAGVLPFGGVFASLVSSFTVETEDAGVAQLEIKIQDFNGAQIVPSITKQGDAELYEVIYTAQWVGIHTVHVNYGDRPVPQSPFRVSVSPAGLADQLKIIDGVEEVILVGRLNSIKLDSSGAGEGHVTCTVKNSKGDSVDVKVAEDAYDQVIIQYVVPKPDKYHVVIGFGGHVIAGGEFTQRVVANLLPSDIVKCRPSPSLVFVRGRMINCSTKLIMMRDIYFTHSSLQEDVNIIISVNAVTISNCLLALIENDYQEHLAKKLRDQQILSASKVTVLGKALDGRNVTFQPTQFTVDCTTAGSGDVSVSLNEAKGKDIAVETTENGDNTFNVEFVPRVAGHVVARVFYADVEIPGSPFQMKILPHINVGAILVEGLQKNAFAHARQEFTVDARAVSDGKVEVTITSPSGNKVDANIEALAEKLYKVVYVLTEEGDHEIDMIFDKLALPSSPFHVSVGDGCDISRVVVSGSGLSSCLTNYEQYFDVDLSHAGRGRISAIIDGPVDTDVKISAERDGNCRGTFVPTVKGSYRVTIQVDKKHVAGSPFLVDVKDEVDVDKIRFALTDNVRVGQKCKIDVDVVDAGEADLNIQLTDPNGSVRNADVERVSSDAFECSFCPEMDGLWQVDMHYGNKKRSGSPIVVSVRPIFEADKVKVYGAGVRPSGGVLATLASSFTVDTEDAGNAQLEINIQDSDGAKIKPSVVKNDEAELYEVIYTAPWVGDYTVDVFYGSPVPESPFHVTVSPTGLADQLKIIDGVEDVILVGHLNSIKLDSSGAGEGHVICSVKNSNGDSVDVEVTENEENQVTIQYSVPTPDEYHIVIGFGGQVIPGGEFTQQALCEDDFNVHLAKKIDETDSKLVNGWHQPLFVYQPVDFCIAVGPVFNFITAIVTTPGGLKKSPEVTNQRNGTIIIRFKPDETGMHQLDVSYNDQPVEGSPFQFFASPIDLGDISASGSGLSHGIATTQCRFNIHTPIGIQGGISVAVEGPSKAEIQCVENGDNTCSVSYNPKVAGKYVINIKFADHHIVGSPFMANISPAGNELQISSASVDSEYGAKGLGVIEDDVEMLQASVAGPSGTLYSNCQVTTLTDGQLGVVFSPREAGEHSVNVTHDKLGLVKGSPFPVFVRESEIGIADMVKVYGTGLAEGSAGIPCQFYIDTADAGCGALSLSVEGPSKTNIECADVGNGKCCVSYQPMTPGVYVINVKFADQLVPGCPFLANVAGQSYGEIELLEDTVNALSDVTHVNSECELYLKLPGTMLEDIGATVTGPSGVNRQCVVLSDGPGIYHVSFMPSETGEHIIDVSSRQSPVPGSPFKFTVGPINSGGAEKVLAVGQGLASASVDEPGQFIIYTREAGLGRLSVSMEGPTRCDINMQDLGDGTCEVTYSCVEPGDYLLSVKFNDIHISNSPCKVFVSKSSNDESQQSNIRKVQNNGCQINMPTSISFQASADRNSMEAYTVAPSGAQTEAIIQEIYQDQYAVRFVPRENGVHFVHVRVNDEPIPESPFRLIVGTQVGDATLVGADGLGLDSGYSGDWLKFNVSTIKAGPGALCVTVDGPSKVRLECTQMKAGYQFAYCPAVAGVYLVSIKYAGSTDIPGSPFRVTVKDKPEITIETISNSLYSSFVKNIKTAGYGLQSARVNEEATFTVNAGPAATKSMLLVGVLGPSGSCREVAVRHNYSGLYTVSYRPIETGLFTIVVKCNDQHIPGSPFNVIIE